MTSERASELAIEVLETPAALAERGAQVLASALQEAVEQRGRATLAVSGGSTPGAMLAALARHPMPWEQVHIVQVDERIAPDGHPDRNLVLLHERFLAAVPGTAPSVHAMPVTAADPDNAARRYAALLVELAGDPPVLDVVQLGMGPDGHTASLVPADPVLAVGDRDVAVTGPYQGRRRLTCTFPLLSRARQRVWLLSGAAKADALARVLAGDRTLPAARIPRRASRWLVDRAAAAELDRADDPTFEEERP
ncbi:MAG: 6-phosphogluconolactonase [Nitriliruptoraceae bacterium]